ncbi:single-stranded DNA-binding protein [Akkermansiaceae bacterium]|nr:single-stranded DNA-binding protein [Akkermansiaceae bacterium]MDB4364259.1 single-stranded DNA-binding protein [Akkermansiaceae bacterium]
MLGDMSDVAAEAKKILETMLGKLGFEHEVEVVGDEDHLTLNILSPDQAILIGKGGDRLDDLQYLTNRILRGIDADAPRVRVDCDGFRTQQEDRVKDKARGLADKVKASGKEFWMSPMNSYHRRLVHNALADDAEVESVSEDSNMRNKKILIRLK